MRLGIGACAQPNLVAHRQNRVPLATTTLSAFNNDPTNYGFPKAQIADGTRAFNNGGATTRLGYFDFGSPKFIKSVEIIRGALQDFGTGTGSRAVSQSVRGSNDLSGWTTLYAGANAAGSELNTGAVAVNGLYRYIDYGPTAYVTFDGYTYIDCLEVVGGL